MGKYPTDESPKRLWTPALLPYFLEMNWTSPSAAVIPCLNEAGSIGEVIRTTQRFVPSVIVIDDGSRDDTSVIAKNAGAEVLRHDFPRGKGAALQAGWAHARRRGFQWAMTMDGDGQHAADDIPVFFDVAERTRAALVVGNRMERAEGMPRMRRVVNRWMSKRISALAGRHLPDSQCGFRLMNLDVWATLPVDAANFEIESEVLVAFARHGSHIEFAPITVIYKDEQSKIHPARDTIRWVRWWWRSSRAGRFPNSRSVIPMGVGEAASTR